MVKRKREPKLPATAEVRSDGVVVVRIPGKLPPSPNARLNPTVLWVARKQEKERVVESLRGWSLPPLELADVEIEFVVPDNRARDYDNALSAVKCWTDGLVAAGVLADDSNRVIRRLTFGFGVIPGLRWTEYRIRPYSARNDRRESWVEGAAAGWLAAVVGAWPTEPTPGALSDVWDREHSDGPPSSVSDEDASEIMAATSSP